MLGRASRGVRREVAPLTSWRTRKRGREVDALRGRREIKKKRGEALRDSENEEERRGVEGDERGGGES